MIVEYTGRNTAITSRVKEITETGMDRIRKVSNGCTSAHIILTEDRHRKIAEVSVKCRGESLVATKEAVEMEAALREALYTVEQQAIRSKERYATVRSHPKTVPAPSL